MKDARNNVQGEQLGNDYRFYTQQVSTFDRRWKSDLVFDEKRKLALESLQGRNEEWTRARDSWNTKGSRKMVAAAETEAKLRGKVDNSSSRLNAVGINLITEDVFIQANAAMISSLAKKLREGEYDTQLQKFLARAEPDIDSGRSQGQAQPIVLFNGVTTAPLPVEGIKYKTIMALVNKRQTVKAIVDAGASGTYISRQLFNRLDFQYMTGVISKPFKKSANAGELGNDAAFRAEIARRVQVDSATLTIAKYASDTMDELAEATAGGGASSIMSPRGQQF